MRGKRAKKLRKQAELYVKNVEKKPLGTGYNSYSYIENRIDWVPQLDDKGYPMIDPDGQPLMKPAKVPGTIFNDYLVRKIYHALKKAYYGRSFSLA